MSPVNLPQDVRGGNSPAAVAALNRTRGVPAQAASDPNQLSSPQMPGVAGGGIAGLLAQVIEMYVAGGANQGDTESIRQFFEQFVAIAAETQQGVASQAATPQVPQGLGQQTAAAIPQGPAAIPTR